MNQNEKMLNDKVSGAYVFRNNLWELARWAEHNNVHFGGTQVKLNALLEGIGNALADSMDGKEVDILSIIERNFGAVSFGEHNE
jgi:hypothetical protein